MWVDFFNESRPFSFDRFGGVERVATCLPVMQEVLQGIDDEKTFREIRGIFEAFRLVEAPLTRATHDEAVAIYRAARRRGLTIRSSVDCLIAACAVRNGLTILHRDRDYDAIARVSGVSVRSA